MSEEPKKPLPILSAEENAILSKLHEVELLTINCGTLRRTTVQSIYEHVDAAKNAIFASAVIRMKPDESYTVLLEASESPSVKTPGGEIREEPKEMTIAEIKARNLRTVRKPLPAFPEPLPSFEVKSQPLLPKAADIVVATPPIDGNTPQAT